MRAERSVFASMAMGALLLWCTEGRAAAAPVGPVLLVSIDGLMPEYYLRADELGLRIPNLRLLMAEGTHAEGVVSVMPSVTFPAHTTMITGVNPNRHGILNNPIFDPDGALGGGWHWYYEDVRVPTLFDAARAAGLKTAAVTWPVTAGGPIDLNLPDMYPVPNLREAKNLASFIRGSRAEALLRDVLPPSRDLIRLKDGVRTKVAIRFLRERPDLLALHFLELDGAQHAHGPGSAEAFATLESIDSLLGELLQTLRADGRWESAMIMVVSDHGFVAVDREVRVGILLRAVGLLQTDGRDKILSWRAMPSYAGGAVGIFLHPEATKEDRQKVDDVVRLLLSNPAYGVRRAFRGADLQRTGGFAGAHVALDAKPGFTFGSSIDAGALVEKANVRGTHGYHPQAPALRASLIVRGPGIRPGGRLGIVRLIDVAPTIARVLGLNLAGMERAGKLDGRVLTEAFLPVPAPPGSDRRTGAASRVP